jgi:hypothetical protein
MSDYAARPRYAPHRRVLSRPDSWAIGAPCVLALRRLSRPLDERHPGSTS